MELQAGAGTEQGRLVLLNVNGLTEEKANELKAFVESEQGGGCAIFFFTEINIDWRASWRSLKEMTRWKVNRHVHYAHNITERSSRLYQPGGVCIISCGSAAARVLASEVDPSGLGRFCSVKYQLKSATLWVVVIYRPCVAPGHDTVYQQHLRTLRANNDDRDPREAILADVTTLVARYKEEGSWVIVAGDLNEDVRSVRIPGLREAITRFQCCPTHQRGLVPIDGFFTSMTFPVTGGGISQTYAISTSDHSAVWLDTPVFGYSPIHSAKIRKLNGRDPKTVDRYLQYMREHWTEGQSDDQIVALMVKSEDKCRKIYTGGLQYSAEISKGLLWIRLWKLRLKRAEGKHVDVSVLTRLENKVAAVDGQGVLSMTLDTVKAGLASARSSFKLIRKQHEELRLQHLEQLAASGSVGIVELRERERSRAVFRRLREAIPSKARRPLFMVQDHDGVWRDTPATIFYAVADENRLRFTQTNDTPLRIEPLRSILGDLGETEAADKVLQGTFDRTDVHQTFVELLPFLATPADVEELEIFTDNDYQNGWRKMDENTGCHGPLHFGHYKAISGDDLLRASAVSFLREQFTSGVPADRWLSGSDVMIEKKPGEYRVEKLRAILLFQADFNFGNKMIGRAMMRQAERLQLLPESQYGSRRSKSASLQLCNKVLMFELSRLQLKPLAYCSTDAKSNYDRIVHSFAVLAMRRLGVPREVALCMFRALQQMRHQVCTGYGLSDDNYSSYDYDPFQGVGQGNGAGPAIWAAVSAPLLAWIDSRGLGVKFQSALSHHMTQISALAFVDDTDLVFSPFTQCLPEDLKEGMQEQLQAWERALRVTGGAIVPEKSFYWTLDFNGDKPRLKQDLPPLLVTDSNGVVGSVPHLPIDEARRTLGVLINPLGEWKDQRNKLRGAMEEWAEACAVSGITRQDAIVELQTRVLPRILYGLEATSYSRADCRYIMSPMLKVGLQKIGITSKLPRPIVFGPATLLGLDLSDIYVEQGVRHLKLLEFHGPSTEGVTGQLLRGLLEEAVVQVGVAGSLFTHAFKDYGMLLSSGWIKSTWLFCDEYQIDVQDWLPHIQPLRENDRFIMTEARRVIPPKDSSSMISFNKCRRFLRVVTMAEVVTGDGRSLRKDILDGRRDAWNKRPIIFTDAHPVSSDWKVWKTVWRKILGAGASLGLPRTLQLGRWFSTVDWKCYISDLEDFVYVKEPLGWTGHRLVSGPARHRRYALVGEPVDDLPPHSRRVVVEKGSQGLFSTGSMGALQQAGGGDQQPEIYCERFGPGYARPADGKITICSDGSYKDGKGTASWVVVAGATEIGEDMVVPDGDHNSYRSELCGILGGLQFLDSQPVHELPQEARIVCDGKSALDVIFGLFSIQMNTPQLDIIREARKCRDSLRAKGVLLQGVHVKGHADDVTPTDELTDDERLNVRMDGRAKAFWRRMSEEGWPSLAASKFRSSCTVRWDSKYVSGSTLKRAIQERELREYWVESKQLTREVDWKSMAGATRAVRRGKGVFLTKFFSGICGVNKWRKRWGMTESDICTRCNLAEETTSHLWVCGVAEARTSRLKALEDIIRWLASQGGNLGFCRTLQSVLGAIARQDTLLVHSVPEAYREVVAAQVVIGWDNFLMGCWAVEWRERLRWEYEALHISRQPERMIASIIERLWETSWDLWLGRNAAVYPRQALTAEGELVSQDIIPSRLCRRNRRGRIDQAGRACMNKWLASGARAVGDGNGRS